MAVTPRTDCRVCGTTTEQTVTEHLAECHINEMLHITTDPRTEHSVIYGRAYATP